MNTVLRERLRAISDTGEELELEVYEVTAGIISREDPDWWLPGTKLFRTSDGKTVQRVESRTYRVQETGKVLRILERNVEPNPVRSA